MDMTNLEPTCRVVGAGARFTGKQALAYTPGISAESVGAPGHPSADRYHSTGWPGQGPSPRGA
jgi:hypothetical protein